MDGFALHPSGQAVGFDHARQGFTFFNHEGPVLQYGKRDGVRYRHAVVAL